MTLTLRSPAPSDECELLHFFTDPQLRQFLGGAVPEEVAAFRAAALTASNRSYPAWVLVHTEEPCIVGFVCLDRHHDGDAVEISFALRSEYQGRGIAAAAVSTAITRARTQGVERLVAETQAANLRALSLLKHLGFIEERRVIRFGAKQVLLGLVVACSAA